MKWLVNQNLRPYYWTKNGLLTKCDIQGLKDFYKFLLLNKKEGKSRLDWRKPTWVFSHKWMASILRIKAAGKKKSNCLGSWEKRFIIMALPDSEVLLTLDTAAGLNVPLKASHSGSNFCPEKIAPLAMLMRLFLLFSNIKLYLKWPCMSFTTMRSVSYKLLWAILQMQMWQQQHMRTRKLASSGCNFELISQA